MRIVYAQGIIKYAHQVDKAVADGSATAYMEKRQAEGQAFARILAPWVHKRSENNATALEYMFDTSEEPRGYAHYNYCAAKAILQADINGGISGDEIEYYDDTEEIVCPTIDEHLDTFSRDSTNTYTPTSIVGPDLSVSQAVAKVKALLGDSSDYAAIKAEYTNSGLRALADTDRTGEPVWDRFKSHFGSATWISDFVDQICDGTTLSSHAEREKRNCSKRPSWTPCKCKRSSAISIKDTRTPTKKNGTKVRQNFTAPKIATALPSLLAATREPTTVPNGIMSRKRTRTSRKRWPMDWPMDHLKLTTTKC